jgi:pyruvate dehydrogenase E1 component alpha subunit
LTAKSLEALRSRDGPVFIECRTYRWREHVGPNEDYDQDYRARSDLKPWIESDQMESLGTRLAPSRRAAIDAEIEREIADAVAFAESSKFPDVEALHTNVFA